MRALTLFLVPFVLLACGEKDSSTDSVPGDDTAPADDTAEGDAWPAGMAELAELSSGECPDLSVSGATSFLSSGESRNVTVVRPAEVNAETQVVIFFHGLTDSGTDPTAYMVSALGLQSLADSENAVILLPESGLRTEFGLSFYLWDVENVSDHDLVLYDDLRTCVSDLLAPDMSRLSVMGFSGGALFSTIIGAQRGDTLASLVSMSGGADLDVAITENMVSPYSTSAYAYPALLVSGGTQDVWPSPQLALIDFVDGTDTLEGQLVGDGHTVVRCRHEQGHTITNAEYNLAVSWVVSHRFGEASPYASGDLGSDASWCELSSQ